MKGRSFVQHSALSLIGTGLGGKMGYVLNSPSIVKKHSFKLNYAPHFGMFKYLAGEDLIDQLRFMSETGFMAFKDNGMKGRSINMQNQIANRVREIF